MARPVEYSPRRTSPPRRRPSEPRGCRRPLVVLCRVMELLEQFRARYPFPLDDFQLEAIRAIEGGQSVIVSAPTGAGKTLVAEFAIHMALATGKRIAYTTPLKALSNQKFNDFTRAFGAETVGILAAPRVHRHVAPEDAGRLGAECPSEVVELLVRERLERRGVRDALARRERHVDGELGDERLSRPGRRRHDDGLSAFDRADGFELEVVERERVPGAKLLEQLHHSTQYHEWSAASAWLLRPSAWQ